MNLDTLYPTTQYKEHVQRRKTPWMVQGLWQVGKINVMFGMEKAGKSRLLNWLLVNLFLHDQVLGMPIENKPSRILYLSGEEPVDEVNARMLTYTGFANEGEIIPLPIEFISAAGMQLNRSEYRKWLGDKLEREAYDMLVIDPLRRVHSGDENSNSDMSLIFNDLRKWTNDLDLTMVLLHHTGKINDETDMDRIGNWGRGATDLAAILDTAMLVSRIAVNKVHIRRQGRYAPLPPLTLLDGYDASFVYARDK